MGVIKFAASLIAGPQQAGEGFPSSTVTASIKLSTDPKSFGVATGVISRRIASPGAFVALQGVGSADTVTKGDFLYLKADKDVDLRMSLDNGAGGTDLRILTGRVFVVEFSSIKFLKLLEAQGSAQLEYFVSGPS